MNDDFVHIDSAKEYVLEQGLIELDDICDLVEQGDFNDASEVLKTIAENFKEEGKKQKVLYLFNTPTCDLVKVLKRRKGVEILVEQGPEGFMDYHLEENKGVTPTKKLSGPHIILRITD